MATGLDHFGLRQDRKASGGHVFKGWKGPRERPLRSLHGRFVTHVVLSAGKNSNIDDLPTGPKFPLSAFQRPLSRLPA